MATSRRGKSSHKGLESGEFGGQRSEYRAQRSREGKQGLHNVAILPCLHVHFGMSVE